MFQTGGSGGATGRRLTSFTAATGERRVVLLADGAGGRVVFDRSTKDPADMRLVARLGSEEPVDNAILLAQLYARDAASRSLRCAGPVGAGDEGEPSEPAGGASRALRSSSGATFQLTRTAGGALRWSGADGTPCSVRDVVGSVESYAPVRNATEAAIGLQSRACAAALRSELRRLLESPIVLNRALRERVERELVRGDATLGELAMRCGRTKRDRSGSVSGDTSWLARRVGLLPEGGRTKPTPWVHTDVLALIARNGLGVTPREVETP